MSADPATESTDRSPFGAGEFVSPAELLAALPEEERESALAGLSPKVKQKLKHHWPFWARPDQLEPPGDWSTWLILAGRGWGKSRTGAETVNEWARSGRCKAIALVAETAADARDVMVKAILENSPEDFMPTWSPTNRCVTWPNGARAWTYNATEPDQLRGPQHDGAWVDELAKFRYMEGTWDQLQFGLRLGTNPKVIVTTTPRPLDLIRKIMADETTYVTRGRTLDNSSNLAESFIRQIEDRYGGTRLGRQELDGELLDDIPGALWTREAIDTARIQEIPEDLERVYVAVDPAASSNEGSDENGIVVVGLGRDSEGYARGYVLYDGSLRGSPEEWSRQAVVLYRRFEADKIIAEKNMGGEMVASVIRAVDRSVPVELVHATRGKRLRAEPISALYEQGRVHHVGRFDKLEDQMCTFSVDSERTERSPDRMDALVWGLTKIFEKISGRPRSKDGTAAHQAKQSKTLSKVNALANCPTGWMA